jgi:hypothetical protein
MPVNVFDDAVAELKKLRSHLMSKSEPVNRFAMELNLVIQNAYQVSSRSYGWNTNIFKSLTHFYRCLLHLLVKRVV